MKHQPEQTIITGIPPEAFKDALKQYRRDVRTVGTISFEQAQNFLEDGNICRGWMKQEDGKMYFHIIKSPTNFPEKAIFSAESEKELFAMTDMLGMENNIELEDLPTEKD